MKKVDASGLIVVCVSGPEQSWTNCWDGETTEVWTKRIPVPNVAELPIFNNDMWCRMRDDEDVFVLDEGEEPPEEWHSSLVFKASLDDPEPRRAWLAEHWPMPRPIASREWVGEFSAKELEDGSILASGPMLVIKYKDEL